MTSVNLFTNHRQILGHTYICTQGRSYIHVSVSRLWWVEASLEKNGNIRSMNLISSFIYEFKENTSKQLKIHNNNKLLIKLSWDIEVFWCSFKQTQDELHYLWIITEFSVWKLDWSSRHRIANFFKRLYLTELISLTMNKLQ